MSVASSIYAIDHPKYIVSNQKVDSVSAFRALLLINCLLYMLLLLFCGDVSLFLVLLCSTWYLFCCCNHLAGEKRAGCFTLIAFWCNVTITCRPNLYLLPYLEFSNYAKLCS